VISVDPNQRTRVRYLLKRLDGVCKVLWRQRLDEGAGGAGGNAAPAAAAPAPAEPPAAADGGP
jgi:hypothetical protein